MTASIVQEPGGSGLRFLEKQELMLTHKIELYGRDLHGLHKAISHGFLQVRLVVKADVQSIVETARSPEVPATRGIDQQWIEGGCCLAESKGSGWTIS